MERLAVGRIAYAWCSIRWLAAVAEWRHGPLSIACLKRIGGERIHQPGPAVPSIQLGACKYLLSQNEDAAEYGQTPASEMGSHHSVFGDAACQQTTQTPMRLWPKATGLMQKAIDRRGHAKLLTLPSKMPTSVSHRNKKAARPTGHPAMRLPVLCGRF